MPKQKIRITAATPFEELPVWLYITEACLWLGISPESYYVMKSRGNRLPFVTLKKGRSYRVNKKQLAEPETILKFRK